MRRYTLLIGTSLMVLFPTLGYPVSAYDAVKRGNALYQNGQYKEAARQYAAAAQKWPDAAEIHFNQGNAYYKQQAYTQALEAYGRALQTADPKLESRIQYNLGNVKYQQALRALSTPQAAMASLRSAMTYYRDSLEIDPHQQDARYNLELAQRLLHQLQKHRSSQRRSKQQEQRKPSEHASPARQEPALQPRRAQRGHPQPSQLKQQQAQRQNRLQEAAPASQAAQPSPPDKTAVPTKPVEVRQDLTPDEAERLLAAIRERAREVDHVRRQQRRLRLHNARVDKDW